MLNIDVVNVCCTKWSKNVKKGDKTSEFGCITCLHPILQKKNLKAY